MAQPKRYFISRWGNMHKETFVERRRSLRVGYVNNANPHIVCKCSSARMARRIAKLLNSDSGGE